MLTMPSLTACSERMMGRMKERAANVASGSASARPSNAPVHAEPSQIEAAAASAATSARSDAQSSVSLPSRENFIGRSVIGYSLLLNRLRSARKRSLTHSLRQMAGRASKGKIASSLLALRAICRVRDRLPEAVCPPTRAGFRGLSAAFLQTELLHPAIQRLAAQSQLARGARDDAAGAGERAFDLGAIRFALFVQV